MKNKNKIIKKKYTTDKTKKQATTKATQKQKN